MRSTVLATALALVSLPAMGCSSETASASSSTTAAAAAEPGSFCDAYCQKRSECDRSEDLQTCTESCSTKLSSPIAKLRADVTSEAIRCWRGSDCRQVLGGNRLEECVDEAAVSASPSPAAKSFCDALGDGLSKCDSGLDRADCLSATKVYSDATIEQAKKCTTKSCSTIMDCVNATL
jgi:hypothetical protein